MVAWEAWVGRHAFFLHFAWKAQSWLQVLSGSMLILKWLSYTSIKSRQVHSIPFARFWRCIPSHVSFLLFSSFYATRRLYTVYMSFTRLWVPITNRLTSRSQPCYALHASTSIIYYCQQLQRCCTGLSRSNMIHWQVWQFRLCWESMFRW